MKKSLKTFETAVINARFQPGLYQIACVAFLQRIEITYEHVRAVS